MTQPFLDRMPATVACQRDLLAALLDVVRAEPALRWFELSCSLARGAGDALSDVDCGVGVAEDRWPDALDLAATLAAAGGRAADTMRQVFAARDGRTGWHEFTLYEDGTQLSLVLMPATWRTGLPPGSVALYDADGRLATPVRPAAAGADAGTLREWSALAWIAIGDLSKYLDRGSLWEAHARLHEARGHLWQLLAAARGVDFPGYGLTALLDEPEPDIPEAMTATVATLEPNALRTAARALAAVLGEVTEVFRPLWRDAGLSAPDGLRRWVGSRL